MRRLLRRAAHLCLGLALLLGSFWSSGAQAEPSCSRVPNTSAAVEKLLPAAKGEAAAHPDRYVNGDAVLWVVRDGSGTLKGHLFGTAHFVHPIATWLPPYAYAAFAKADRFVTETDITALTETDLARIRSRLDGRAAWTDPTPMVEAADKRAPGVLQAQLRRWNLPPDKAEQIGPFALANRLSKSSCVMPYQRIYGSGHTIDHMLAEWAHAMGKSAVPLESLEDALEAIGYDQPHAELLDLLLVSIRRYQDGDFERAMLALYREGEVGMMLALERVNSVDEASHAAMEARLSRMYGLRNDRFAAELVKAFQEPGLTFAAIGAGHLVGESGLVSQLRSKGWTIEACAADAC